ncbi:MAG: polysaccharide deacetylase family protein [Acetobacteraceae bacterium]|nr:polysaccharide deacetylase family protein [Acetobacteraceae bacterium]MBV8591295.1 polysaccharide deacetylase family protein [Acetobacteraceae bacterium]
MRPLYTGSHIPSQHITFTVDVEDYRRGQGRDRCVANTTALLGFFKRFAIRATFFIDASLAADVPGLVREIARRGHEVACHSFRHRPLTEENRAHFGAALADARAQLEDWAGGRVVGFRAPEFSLTPATAWAVEAIGEAGFLYSSSVLPGRGLAHGWPGAPPQPFLWSNGVLEIPCPVGQIGRFSLAFLGGMYLRYLPPWRLRWLAAQLGDQVRWTYCHPYDIDTEEGLVRVPGKGWLASLFLCCNRRVLLRRWERFAPFAAPPFADRIGALRERARVFGVKQIAEAG